jgi:TolB-like protein
MYCRINLLALTLILLLMPHQVFAKNIAIMAIMPFENVTKDADKKLGSTINYIENIVETLTKDADNNWIGAGFAETLTTKLCKVKEVKQLKREQLSKLLDEIMFQRQGVVDEGLAIKTGKSYGIDIMIFGSCQVKRGVLRVNAKIVDVKTGKVINSAVASGKVADIFEIQNEIAFSMMDSLKIALSDKEKKILRVINPTKNLVAYKWCSKACEAYNLRQYDKTIKYAQKAINLDPKYALAYIFMGTAYAYDGNFEKVIELYGKAICVNSKFVQSYYKMELAALCDILDLSKKAVNINSANSIAGYTYSQNGKHNSALEMSENNIVGIWDFNSPYIDAGRTYIKDVTGHNPNGTVIGGGISEKPARAFF